VRPMRLVPLLVSLSLGLTLLPARPTSAQARGTRAVVPPWTAAAAGSARAGRRAPCSPPHGAADGSATRQPSAVPLPDGTGREGKILARQAGACYTLG
jgi:hypothetical protein